MQVVPLQSVPNQSLSIILNNQNCLLNVYQQFWGLFMDILLNNIVVIKGVLCLNQNFIVRSTYLGFSGDFTFLDNQPNTILGPSAPYYTGLGSRYSLIYLAPSDIMVIDPDYGLST